MNTPHLLIIGAGSGGWNVPRQRRDAPVQITLIDMQNYHPSQLLPKIHRYLHFRRPLPTSFSSNWSLQVMINE